MAQSTPRERRRKARRAHKNHVRRNRKPKNRPSTNSRRTGCVLTLQFLGKLGLATMAKSLVGARAKQARFDTDGCFAALILRSILGLATLAALIELVQKPHVSVALGFRCPLTFVNPISDLLKRFSVKVGQALIEAALHGVIAISGAKIGQGSVLIDSTYLIVFGKTYERATRGYSSILKKKVMGYRLQVAYDLSTRLPLAIYLMPGHRNDHKGLKPLVQRLTRILGDKRPELVMDRGYCAAGAYRYLERKGFPFVIRSKTNANWIKRALAIAHGHGYVRRTGSYKSSSALFTLPKSTLTLKLIVIRHDAFKKPLLLVTNRLDWTNSQVYQIYRKRGYVEAFFKELRQRWNLNTFVGTSWSQVLGHVYTTLLGYIVHQGIRLSLDHTRRKKNILYFRRHVYAAPIEESLLEFSLSQITRKACHLAAVLRMLLCKQAAAETTMLEDLLECCTLANPVRMAV